VTKGVDLSAIYGPVREGMSQVEGIFGELRGLARQDILPLLDQTLHYGGKRLRPALTLLSGAPFEYRPHTLHPMAAAMELFHTATLVHDDIVDASSLRRGRATINSMWGDGAAVLLGDFFFAHSARLVASTDNLRVINLFAKMLMAISGSELAQNLSTMEQRLDYDHYIDWIGAKTASLFATATESGAVLGGSGEDGIQALKAYGHHFGLAFQIVDDILDFVGQEQDLGKPVGADLVQGNPTLPTILFVAGHPQGADLRRALTDGGDAEAVKKAVALIPGTDVIAECRQIARGFTKQALKALDAVPPCPSTRALSDLATYIMSRSR
jgi:heptaprenyl diphosphate synthase/octaprenyl-diphosphate synthase